MVLATRAKRPAVPGRHLVVHRGRWAQDRAYHSAGCSYRVPDPERASPRSIEAGKDGNLWFTEAGSSNSIGRVTPEGSVAEYPMPSAASDPAGISAGPDAACGGTSHACSFTVHGAAP